MTIGDFITHFDGVKRVGAGYAALCPVHGDRKQSLSISPGDKGGIVLHCHAGCTVDEILEAVGLTAADIAAPKPTAAEAFQNPRAAVASYHYKDADGKEVAIKIRRADKSFGWRDPNAEGDAHFKKPKGIPPYNLPAVLSASTVYIVEGEKDVDTLTRNGLAASCSPDGAGPGKWRDHLTGWFKGKNVVIIQDNDDTGKAFAQEEAQKLHRVAQSVKVIDLTKIRPNLKEHGDITDLVELIGADAAVETVKTLAQAVPAWTEGDSEKIFLETISASDLQDKDLPPAVFVIKNLLTTGLAMLSALPKSGKSWMVLDMCLAVSSGVPFLGYDTEQAGCLYLALEDTQRRLKDRMNKLLNGKRAPSCFEFATSALDIDNGLIEQLEGHVLKHPQTKLIVIDTLQKIRGRKKSNEDSYSDDYRTTGVLKQFADKHSLCILLVHHLRKMKDADDPFNQISGTNGIFGGLDTSIVLTKEKRADKDAKMFITGRDIDYQEKVVTFDRGKWSMRGDADFLERERARLEYENSPIVKTIRKLLEQSPEKRWDGTAKELLEAGRILAGTYISPTATELGKKLKALGPSLFNNDQIIYSCTRHGNAGKNHHFYYSGFTVAGENEQTTLK